MKEIFPTAEMVQRGFENTATKDDFRRLDQRMDGFDTRMDGFNQRMDGFDQRMDGFDQRLEKIDGRLDHLDARMGRMEADLNDIQSHIVYRHEFEDLMGRVKYIEKKLNIESGV